jgi:hypothetical protein
MIMAKNCLTSKLKNWMLYILKNIKAKHMIKKAVLTLTTLLLSSTALANSSAKPVETEQTTNFIVTPSVAYRYDIFKWSTPLYPLFQTKESELIWKNHIVQPSIKIELEPKPNQFTFLGQVKYGYILKNLSKNWDLDWLGNHKESKPYSKTLSLVKGNILDLSGAIGYAVNFFQNNLLTFYAGYDYTDYRNKQYGIRQLVNNRNDLLYPSNQLISKYNFTTQAPWIGLSLQTPLNEKFTIIPTIKYYSFNYVGKGYWLLRDDLQQNPSFKHTAKGQGLGFDVDFLYKYSDNLDLKINLETKKLKMKKGKDQIFYNAKNVGGKRIATRKLFDLSLLSLSITMGLQYKF